VPAPPGWADFRFRVKGSSSSRIMGNRVVDYGLGFIEGKGFLVVKLEYGIRLQLCVGFFRELGA
jgi:hypothetical protein